ncbi:MAG: ABC transporter permease [Candidatus Brocadiae bacterium]|nr:ABC transporter permease [Candidatus Brocadiia bacterium]
MSKEWCVGIARPIANVGRFVAEQVSDLGRFTVFSASTLRWILTDFTRWRLLRPQLYEVGVRSLPVIIFTGAFVGMVLALQSYPQFELLGRASWLGMVVNLSVVKELGPVLAGVMIAGRVGGALAAGLGTMKVTEQIDALRAMGADPIRHLVVPRFLACLLLIPFLTVYCDFVGIVGGYVVAWGYGVDTHEYWMHSADVIENWDLFAGIFKSVFFGAAIALISCYKGFRSRQGAEGVGRAATEAFVASFMAILILDLFIVMFLQGLYEALWGRVSIFI